MFKQRIRELRKSKELTLREMAADLQIPLSTVSKYEQGVIKPGVDILWRYATVYNVNLNWLLTGVGEMFNESIKELALKDKVIELMVEKIEQLHYAMGESETKDLIMNYYTQQAKELMKGKE